jgi:pyruvate/2-oxoglutarate dehydrogenase complex dihydrolipoamide acyltransferase (E2) component
MATTSVRIPKAGQAMTEGTIGEWLVADGASVDAGETIYRLETEKVEIDVEAPTAGTITIVEAAGTTHDVGTEIARIEH